MRTSTKENPDASIANTTRTTVDRLPVPDDTNCGGILVRRVGRLLGLPEKATLGCSFRCLNHDGADSTTTMTSGGRAARSRETRAKKEEARRAESLVAGGGYLAAASRDFIARIGRNPDDAIQRGN